MSEFLTEEMQKNILLPLLEKRKRILLFFVLTLEKRRKRRI